MKKKSLFSSKGATDAVVDENVEKKGSFLEKLNQPLFSSKKKEVNQDESEYFFDAEEKASEKFMSKLNQPLFTKKTKKAKAPAIKANQPYTMFGKPIKGNLLAIDFDDESVHLVLARQKRKTIEVINSVSTALPENVVYQGDIVDAVVLEDIISSLISQYNLSAKYAFFALNNNHIIARSVDVVSSVQSDEDIQGLVAFELQQYLDIDPTSYVIQYQELNEKQDPDAETRSLMVYAVPEMVVEKYLTLAENLKLVPYVFDLQSNSFEKWLDQVQAINNQAKRMREQNIGIVHLSKTAIEVYLYSEGKFVTSNYHDGGYEMILNVADDSSILQKLSLLATNDLDTSAIKQALDSWLDDARNHILNTENFFTSSTGYIIDTFYVYGDQDVCWQLASILKNKLGRDFVSIDSVDCENIVWEGTTEFSAEYIPATAMLIRRSN